MNLTNNKKVIPFPEEKPKPWRFFGIRYPNGTQPLDDWFRDDLSEEAQFALIDALKDARKVDDPTNWLCFKRRMKGKLGKYKVWELRFSCGDNREYRLLGVFGSERKQAIFLMGCYHKGNVYTPTDALGTTLKRAKDWEEKRVTIYERKMRTDR
jgi:hypothetical protein